ncbi:hypothetical protein CAOG_06150 [Capsaspora owczarzaki ATCC 30864]|uniref:hypothetical protein n=1 Tax=Capsaspora owczarzaki (strain ATCC 30864) TaxID=595528 RepID=UPI0001FE2764|nr:hypothetical protein CAOG_06150 [Capsaspora owczarzaki ATCC 30864]|eukprot:XP_004345740.1 hypothetical protein CAOG_06150 [Capsaspora owczarzaki ATCC 30864]
MSYPSRAAGGGPSTSAGSNDRLRQTQDQVDEVVGIMKNNVEKVLERDAKLTDIQDKSEALRDGAERFQTTSRKLKRKMWYKNIKFMIILVVVVLILIGAIVLWAAPWK